MSFVLEASKNSKDFILFNNYKYRECYSLKCGDVVWRCLGKNCKASLKTDKQKTAIYFSNEDHSGPHPVTMRALTSTPPVQRKHPATPKNATQTSILPSTAALTPSPITPTTASTPTQNIASLDESLLLPTQLQAKDLKEENSELKLQLAALREERRALIEHSIESDQRLLQYTEDVFLSPVPPSKPPLPSTSTCVSNTDCAVQWDTLMKELTGLNNKIDEANKENISLRQSQLKLSLHLERITDENCKLALEISKLSNQLKQTVVVNDSLNYNDNNKKLDQREVVKSRWLADDLLAAHFNLLNKEVGKFRSDVLFVNPSVTQLLKLLSRNEVESTLRDLSFSKMAYVFLCVNDCNEGMEINGGSHWSLVLYNNVNKNAVHYDSAPGVNRVHAEKLIANLGLCSGALSEATVLRQTDDHECGLHVLVNTRLLLSQICVNVPLPRVSPTTAVITHSMPAVSPLPACIPTSIPSGTISPQYRLVDSLSHDNLPQQDYPNLNNINNNNWCKVTKKMHTSSSKIIPSQISTSRNKFSVLDSIDSSNVIHNNNLRIDKNYCSLKFKHEQAVNKSNFVKHSGLDGRVIRDKNVQRSKVIDSVKSRHRPEPDLPKIRIFSDSHGRSIATKLRDRCADLFDVQGITKPNGKFSQVVEGVVQACKTFSKNDVVIIMAGTNDVDSSSNSRNEMVKLVKNLILKLSNTKLIFIGLPYRWDVPELNQYIHNINNTINACISDSDRANFVPVNFLFKTQLYTKYGLHLNHKGKTLLVNYLLNLIKRAPGVNNSDCIQTSCPSETTILKPMQHKAVSKKFLNNGKAGVFENRKRFLDMARSMGRGP